MATSAVSAFASVFRWDSQSPVEIKSISGPSETMDPIEVTSHDSPDGFREFIAGLHDGGEISIEGNLIVGDTDGQVAMHTDFQATTVKAWEIRFPSYASAPVITGNGYITAFSFDFPFDGPITFSATIKITGKPTYTPA